jgi:anti-sigma B factor antagonist
MGIPNEPLILSIDRPQPGVAVVVPNGELDLDNQQKLRDALQALGNEDLPLVIVDLRRLRFMDSSGLRVLIDAWNEAAAADRRFAVVALKSGIIRRVLEVSGCDAVFQIGEDVSELLVDSLE